MSDRAKRRDTPVHEAIRDRVRWEERQRVYYQMRHNGLPRRRKPFPGASDVHFPLIDSVIERMKPFFYNQIFQTETLASFTALTDQPMDTAATCAEYFDYALKQETDFEDEVLVATDDMLQNGRGILKWRWDPLESTIVVEAVNPLYFIVPRDAPKQPESMDWFVNVKHVSVEQYKRNPLYLDHSEELINKLRGGAEASEQNEYEEEKAYREGLTYSRNEDVIVIWEHWRRNGRGWRIDTYSPAQPDTDLRKPIGLTYKWQGKPIVPFVAFHLEHKAKGWYDSRGIPDRLGSFENALCKTWNDKLDWQTILNRPYWKDSQGKVGNTANFRARPGELLPHGVEPANMPNPPSTFDQEMMTTRSVAEQLIMLPDFGTGNQQQGKDNKTATEVQAIMNMSSQGIDLRGRTFRNSLGRCYTVAWAILVQFRTEEIVWYTSESRKTLPAQALHDLYRVEPDGATDQWNKQLRYQKAHARYQLFKGHQNVNQDELVKSVLKEDDARLVRDLFMPTNAAAASEIEDEQLEIILMERGFPAAVKPNEDHATRLFALVQRMRQMDQMGAEPNPQFAQLITQHMQAHLQLLQEQNPQGAKQVKQQIAAMLQQGAAPMGQPQPPMAPQPTGPAPTPAPMQQGAPRV